MRPTAPPGPPVGNRLLASLPAPEYERLLPHLQPISLGPTQCLFQPGDGIGRVYFPVSSILATLVVMQDGTVAQAGLIGSEGVACLCTILGCDTTPFAVEVQNAGAALWMDADRFREEARRNEVFHGRLHQYADAFLTQVSYTAACNSLHTVEQRCCRWLLMMQNRAVPDHFLLTQQTIARMLGVRRSSVQEVARRFQEAGLIHYRRGRIQIIDRPGLEARCCECYRNTRERYGALLGGPS